LAEKKTTDLDIEIKKQLINREDETLTIGRQCDLLALPRSTFYYHPCLDSSHNLLIMREIDEIFTEHPVYGTRRIHVALKQRGHNVGRDLIRSLMKKMGIEATYAKPNLSKRHPGHEIYPYLLRGVKPKKADQIWSTDITYIRVKNGFFYLTAIMDWYSRYVLSWKLSNSLEGQFCRDALLEALKDGKPEIFNTDQGVQFTQREFVQILLDRGIKPSMDGRGRALDNVFVERLWRSVKYEHVFLNEYMDGRELQQGLASYFMHYNERRPHMSLKYEYPINVYKRGVMISE
jgi:putative transposase